MSGALLAEEDLSWELLDGTTYVSLHCVVCPGPKRPQCPMRSSKCLFITSSPVRAELGNGSLAPGHGQRGVAWKATMRCVADRSEPSRSQFLSSRHGALRRAQCLM